MPKETTKVHPNSSKNTLVMGLISILLTIGGALLILSGGGEKDVITGVLFVLVFGSAIILSIRDLIMLRIAIVLTPEHLEYRCKNGTTYTPWSDIESVGVIKVMSRDHVGIRLKSYDYYLESMSPPVAHNIRKILPFRKLISGASLSLDRSSMATIWSKLEGKDYAEVFIKYGKVGDLAKSMLWARHEFGYDIMFSWDEIDRSEKNFVKLLNNYLQEDQTD